MTHRVQQRRIVLLEPVQEGIQQSSIVNDEEARLVALDQATPVSAEYLSLALFFRRYGVRVEGSSFEAENKRAARHTRFLKMCVKKIPDNDSGIIVVYPVEALKALYGVG